ncbi:cytochrome P450 family 89 subfamily A polypeptide 5 [Citrus sinensis]|uniref:Cytochrome P450 family 89 subfamily A polypeptide 5 n=1 Tax=Citrus sinensis TaxID=2711 RepID=A0ACB8LD40_CITSI|nr:cytochrome P450 family 89 subfamily A polypeptide 5 [Citrus sinensis]
MEFGFIILISIAVAALLKAFIGVIIPSKYKTNLPPGPFNVPLISNLQWLLKSFTEIEPILRNLHSKLGPVVTLYVGPRPAISIADRSLAHKALVQNGAIFADRPPPLPTWKIISSNQHDISSASYGTTWRVFRRNLSTEILHPLRVKSYRHARKWVLEILLNRLKSESKNGDRPVPVRLLDHFLYAMFCLLVLMCFGDKLDESQIKRIENVQRRLLLAVGKFNVLNFWPRLTKIVFAKKWIQFLQVRRDQENVLVPLIRARKKMKEEESLGVNKEEYVLSYVDTLLDLQLHEEKRRLSEEEIVSLCSEFLSAGTESTSTALQWIMANLVKHPHVQEKVYTEIRGVVGENEEVKEEELQEMPYLKAVILEGLRRHPPGHFVLPHAVTEDFVLDDKYVIPKDGSVNFMVADMGWDPTVWEDPMAFKPERFLNDHDHDQDFDITGSREIKMMPFGAGRRICPGFGLAMLHLEYFVANLVRNFEWKTVDGDEVDLTEKQEFTVVMKNPLQALLSPRTR